MVTATPGLALGILTADCAPVLFADRQGARDRRRPCRLERRAGWRPGSHLDGDGKTGRQADAHPGHHRAHASARTRMKWAGNSATVSWNRACGSAAFSCRPTKRAITASICQVCRPARLTTAGGSGNLVETHGGLHLSAGKRLFQLSPHHPQGEPDYGRQISAIVLTGNSSVGPRGAHAFVYWRGCRQVACCGDPNR